MVNMFSLFEIAFLKHAKRSGTVSTTLLPLNSTVQRHSTLAYHCYELLATDEELEND